MRCHPLTGVDQRCTLAGAGEAGGDPCETRVYFDVQPAESGAAVAAELVYGHKEEGAESGGRIWMEVLTYDRSIIELELDLLSPESWLIYCNTIPLATGYMLCASS